MKRALVLALPLALVLAVTLWRSAGPPPLSADAPSGLFSADRAAVVLRNLVSTGVPHPVGSAANLQVRQRIESEFQRLGYETEIQRSFACNARAICGNVENVIARTAGRGSGDIVLMLAHYDSVAAGPGVSDDAMGVAALLEVARAVREDQFRNDVVFLITDGEEGGLLGAEAFVKADLINRVGVVVNVENRGTRGPSNLFETSRGNAWLIRNIAPNLPRPSMSSLYYEIYNLLPNDTDLTVFKRAAKAGVNFAAIGGVNRYHTPNDDLRHASARTLQHHGENLLGTLRGLADADLAARKGGDAVYFDVLGSFVVRWPEKWTPWAAVASLALLVWAGRPSRSRPPAETAPPRRQGLQPTSFGVLATFTALLLTAAAGAAVGWLVQLGAGGTNWSAYPLPAIVSMWLTGIGAPLAAFGFFRRRASGPALLLGAAIVWHMIAIALALTIPGSAYLFLVPAATITAATLARTNVSLAAAAGTTVAAILFFPVAVGFYDALGNGMLAVIAILIGAATTLAAPLFPSWRIGAVAGALAIGGAVIAAVLPQHTEAHPRHVSLSWVDDPAAESPRWTTAVLTDALRTAAAFTEADPELTPWTRATIWSAPAPRLELPRVELTGERTGDHLTIHVRSARRADRLVLLFRGGTVLRVNGSELPPASQRRPRSGANTGWEVAAVHAMPEMSVEIAASGPVEAIASDLSFGLPAEGAALARARDASPAVPVHDGDLTITRARGVFEPSNVRK